MAGIVVAVIFLFAALVGVIVVSVILFGRFRYKSGDMSIQLSRKGSMRLVSGVEGALREGYRTLGEWRGLLGRDIGLLGSVGGS